MSWEEIVKEEKERKVFEALADHSWDFRTVDGISNFSGLSAAEVTSIIAKYPNLIRKSAIPDRKGRDLFTLAERPIGTQEVFAEIQTYVTKSVR